MSAARCADRMDPFPRGCGWRSGAGGGIRSRYRIAESPDYRRLPPFREVPPSDRESLFVGALRQCSITFNFDDAMWEMYEKEVKRMMLLELVRYVSSERSPVAEETYPEIVKMISANLFRKLAPCESSDYEPCDAEPAMEPAWPHLHLVYEFFLKFLEAPDFAPSVARAHIDEKFVLQLLALLDSEDPRERAYVRTSLQRVYVAFPGLRPFIRKQIDNVLLAYIYEKERFNGIGSLLEIVEGTISGFDVPLKSEHVQLLTKVLLPLHKSNRLSRYCHQLAYCVVRFLEKDPSLSESVVVALLKMWPRMCAQREVLFLGEMEEILETMEPSRFARIQEPLFRQLSKCVSSPHFQVAERALSLWSNEYVLSLIEENAHVIMPVMYPALYRVSKEHWNEAVVVLVNNVLESFADVNSLPAPYPLAARPKGRKREREVEVIGRRVKEVIINARNKDNLYAN